MAITFSGLATGLDTDSIVSQIMEIERLPIDRLEEQRNYETERLNAFYQFKGKLDDLKTAASDLSLTSYLRTTNVSLSSEDAFSATSNNAAEGSYDIAVAQLAQVQKSVSDGFSSSTDSLLGTGTITVNGVEIAVTSENNSLTELASSINEQSDLTGVKVSIINDGSTDSPYHLVFTGQDANTSFDVAAALESSPGVSFDFNTTVAKTAQQAVAFIDGLKVVSDSNTISDAISGLTLNLDAVSQTSSAGVEEAGVDPWDWATPPVYTTTRLDISQDTEAVKEKITSFVTAYNSAMEFINSGYEDEFGTGTPIAEETDGEDGESSGDEELLGAILRGDATVNSVKRSLQSTLTDSVNGTGTFSILAEIGISSQIDGTLKQDNTKLDEALTNNFDDVVKLLSGEDEVEGVMKKFNFKLLDITSVSSGMYANQKNSYLSSVKDIDSQIELYESRMTKREATLRAQFTAMETLISEMNSQSTFLTQFSNSLNNNTE